MKERDSNIELLRIIATLFILVTHCNGWFLREWGSITSWNTGGYMVGVCRVLIQNISCLGVDIFVLISGFYGIRPKVKSIVNLFTLLLFFYVGCYCWDCYLGNDTFTFAGLMANTAAFSRENWFINSYIFLMLLSPLVNAFVDKESPKTIALYIVIFAVLTLYFGCYRSNPYWYYNWGYSVTMMLNVYLVGKILGKCKEQLRSVKYVYLVFIFVFLIGLMSVVRLISSNEEVWLHYGSPLTICASCTCFLLFYRLPTFHSGIVNWIGKSCLACFILHVCNPVFDWLVQKDILYFTSYSFPIYCIKISVAILGVFVAAILLDKVRLFVFKPLIELSGKIKVSK